MTVRVKICGITTPEACEAVVAAGADWLGFNFYPASPRYVTVPEAAALSARYAAGPARVALLVNPADDALAEVVVGLRPDVLQLHDVEDARVAEIAARFGVPVWQTVGVAAAADLPLQSPAAALLLDAKPMAGSLPGGNATAFDWAVLRGWQAPRPWLLAGGLTPGNVAEAIRRSGATAVDVASGVEATRGVKDAGLIAAFVAAAKAA